MNFVVGKDSVISVKTNIRILLITYKMFPDEIKLFSGMSIDFKQLVCQSFHLLPASSLSSLRTEEHWQLSLLCQIYC